jgi:hypothetical protein
MARANTRLQRGMQDACVRAREACRRFRFDDEEKDDEPVAKLAAGRIVEFEFGIDNLGVVCPGEAQGGMYLGLVSCDDALSRVTKCLANEFLGGQEIDVR